MSLTLINSSAPIEKASNIIKKLQIRDPSEILIKDISILRGIFVKEEILEGSEARLIKKGNKGIITVSNKIPEIGRKRFAIAHEVGHFELHKKSQLIHCNEEDLCAWNENKKQEIEANEFAANILMPSNIFIRFIKKGQPNFENIKKLSNEFRTTLTATAIRYVSLSSEPCAIVVTQNDIIRWYKKSTSFQFYIKVGDNLSPYTYSNGLNEFEDIPKKPTKVPASAWLMGIKKKDSLLYEQSVKLKRYNILLSLLWIDDDIY